MRHDTCITCKSGEILHTLPEWYDACGGNYGEEFRIRYPFVFVKLQNRMYWQLINVDGFLQSPGVYNIQSNAEYTRK